MDLSNMNIMKSINLNNINIMKLGNLRSINIIKFTNLNDMNIIKLMNLKNINRSGKELGRRDARECGERWGAEFGGRCERDLDEGVGGDSGEVVEDNSEGESREGVGGDSVRSPRNFRGWPRRLFQCHRRRSSVRL
jgi:hypothetical protein